MSHPGTVEILVKNPSGEGDSVLLVPLTSSILDLKHKIAEQHPKKPDVSSQRLIFSGRILRDDDVLQYIFNPNLHDLSARQIFHLTLRPTVNNYAHPAQNGLPDFIYPQPPQDPNTPFQQQHFHNPNMYPGNYNPQFNPNGPAPVFHAQVHRAGFALNIDFSLVIKLILLVYVLGQDRPPQVFVALAVAAVAYYLYNTAAHARIFGGQDQQQQPQQPQQQPQQQGPQNDAGVAGQPGAYLAPDQSDIPWYVRDNAGFPGEIFRFVVPFCLSLFPGWTFPDDIPDRSLPPPVVADPEPRAGSN